MWRHIVEMPAQQLRYVPVRAKAKVNTARPRYTFHAIEKYARAHALSSHQPDIAAAGMLAENHTPTYSMNMKNRAIGTTTHIAAARSSFLSIVSSCEVSSWTLVEAPTSV